MKSLLASFRRQTEKIQEYYFKRKWQSFKMPPLIDRKYKDLPVKVEEVARDLALLVSINTVDSRNGRLFLSAVRWLLDRHGINYRVVRAIEWRGLFSPIISEAYIIGEGPYVLVDSHYDTVNASPSWRPWTPRIVIDGDKPLMVGRGSGDNKFGIVASLIAAKLLGGKGGLIITVTADEERGGEMGIKKLLSKLSGEEIKAAIVLEPTTGQACFPQYLKTGSRGFWKALIEVEGQSLKASYPVGSEGPIYGFVASLIEEGKLNDSGRGELNKGEKAADPHTMLRITYLKSSREVGLIPRKAELELTIRYSPKKTEKDIRSFLDKVSQRASVTYKYTVLRHYPPYVAKRGELYKKTLRVLEEIAAEMKKRGRPCRKVIKTGIEGGGSNMRHIIDVGIEAVEFGPRIINAHKDNEAVDIIETIYTGIAVAKIVETLS